VSAPPVQYATNGDVHIAYRVLGEGPLDLVFVAGAITNLDVLWEMSDYRRGCERLASFSRLILLKDLVAGSGIEFADRGVHELKGIPGEWRLYAAK
jgi:hypothetical protein